MSKGGFSVFIEKKWWSLISVLVSLLSVSVLAFLGYWFVLGKGFSFANVIAVLACTLLVSFISALTDVTISRCSDALAWRLVDSAKGLKHDLIASSILLLLNFMWPVYGVVGCYIISGYFAGGFKSLASAVIWFLVYAAYAFVLRKSSLMQLLASIGAFGVYKDYYAFVKYYTILSQAGEENYSYGQRGIYVKLVSTDKGLAFQDNYNDAKRGVSLFDVYKDYTNKNEGAVTWLADNSKSFSKALQDKYSEYLSKEQSNEAR